MWNIFRFLSRRRAPAAAVESTPFSEFFRKATSEEKKKVYVRALKKASAEQNKVVERHRACA